jgi:hypothetical protein
MIKGKSPEEIRKTFNIQNDFTPEEEDQIRRENEWAEEYGSQIPTIRTELYLLTILAVVKSLSTLNGVGAVRGVKWLSFMNITKASDYDRSHPAVRLLRGNLPHCMRLGEVV